MPTRPNLLFIFTDEQRADTLGSYGNRRIQTPALDLLAGHSFVFENAYVTQPVCTPSRSTIMTGLWPHTNGCTANNQPLRPETPTIAEMISDDYACAYYGKWHLGDEVVPQHGFDRWVSIEDMYRPHYSSPAYLERLSDYHHFLIDNGLSPDAESCGAKVFSRTMAADLPEALTKASFLGRQAAGFIRENRDRPFALYVNFLEPHMPFTGPLNDLYPWSDLATGPHFLKPPPPNASLLHRMMAEHYMHREFEGCDLTTEAGWRQIRAQYWGLVTLVDRAVAVILRELDECSLADNTIVVFTSDHGDMMGDHAILAKCVMYEEAIKVPLLIRVPWLSTRQQRIAGRISQIDLVPTLLDLMGQPIPGHLQGRSRADVLCGQGSLDSNDVFVEWNSRDGRPNGAYFADIPPEQIERLSGSPWRTVISADGWKLNLSPDDQCELYDLNADPYEQQNLFDDPAQQDRIRDLTERIRQWQAQTRDDAPLPRV